MNRGAQLLREKLVGHGAKKAFADSVGIKPAQLSHWLAGSRVPDTRQRATIEDAHGIGWRTWDEVVEEAPAKEPAA